MKSSVQPGPLSPTAMTAILALLLLGPPAFAQSGLAPVVDAADSEAWVDAYTAKTVAPFDDSEADGRAPTNATTGCNGKGCGAAGCPSNGCNGQGSAKRLRDKLRQRRRTLERIVPVLQQSVRWQPAVPRWLRYGHDTRLPHTPFRGWLAGE